MKRRRLHFDGFDFLQLGDPKATSPDDGPIVDVPDDLYERFCRALEEMGAVDDLIRQRFCAALVDWERSRAAQHTSDLSPSPEWQGQGRGGRS